MSRNSDQVGKGLQACLPQGSDPLNATAVLDTSSLARTYPWSAGALVHRYGVPLGVALGSTSPVWVDPWHPELSNAHLGVFAMSGAGKTFYVVMYARRAHLMRRRPLWILDQTKDREYRPTARKRQASVGCRSRPCPAVVFLLSSPRSNCCMVDKLVG